LEDCTSHLQMRERGIHSLSPLDPSCLAIGVNKTYNELIRSFRL
jgi:hypothetical protein